MKNTERYDLSNRLIHFFRKLDLEDGSAPDVPEDWGLGSIAEDAVYSPMFLMRCAIRHGHLWATWSRRKNVRTIYGPYPATCFTDMPMAAFIEASRTRQAKGEKISTYALTFPKDQMFRLGANPVIYGLSNRALFLPSGKDGGPRIIPEDVLPIAEQYRYVTYNPGVVDWTHEREWRLPYQCDLSKYEDEIKEFGIVDNVSDIPGLNLYDCGVTGIGVIVNSHPEANMVLHDILSLYDQGIIHNDTFSYIFVTEEIEHEVVLRDPQQERLAIEAALIDLDFYLVPRPARDKKISRRIKKLILEVEEKAETVACGEYGGCWLWFVDIFHEVTRALINEGLISVNNDGKYLLPLTGYDESRSLRQREEMTKKLAAMLHNEFGITVGYFSVLNSNDYNKLPSYNDDHLDNGLHYNWWNYGL